MLLYFRSNEILWKIFSCLCFRFNIFEWLGIKKGVILINRYWNWGLLCFSSAWLGSTETMCKGTDNKLNCEFIKIYSHRTEHINPLFHSLNQSSWFKKYGFISTNSMCSLDKPHMLSIFGFRLFIFISNKIYYLQQYKNILNMLWESI